jgi:hypothetical protein
MRLSDPSIPAGESHAKDHKKTPGEAQGTNQFLTGLDIPRAAR